MYHEDGVVTGLLLQGVRCVDRNFSWYNISRTKGCAMTRDQTQTDTPEPALAGGEDASGAGTRGDEPGGAPPQTSGEVRQSFVAGPSVPDCGTPGTPPCPPPNVFFETRALVIDRLAGAEASRERRRTITAQVDTYLQAALRSAFVLLQGLHVPGSEHAQDSRVHVMPPKDPGRSPMVQS
jgi:hypothetical protein